MTDVDWYGPICSMCNGKGKYRFHAADYDYIARCPACNGHGKEPS